MRSWAERVAASAARQVSVSERRMSLEVKLDPCGHHSCAVSVGCSGMVDCCTRCPLPECRQGSGIGNYGPTSTSGARRAARDKMIAELRGMRVPVNEIAEAVNISQRRVWGVLAECEI